MSVAARHGREATVKRITIPTVRDKTSISPLEWVSLDGRTQDFWVEFGDGRAVRPVMMVLIYVASNMVLGWELAETENAAGTVRVIKRVCETYGIFDASILTMARPLRGILSLVATSIGSAMAARSPKASSRPISARLWASI